MKIARLKYLGMTKVRIKNTKTATTSRLSNYKAASGSKISNGLNLFQISRFLRESPQMTKKRTNTCSKNSSISRRPTTKRKRTRLATQKMKKNAMNKKRRKTKNFSSTLTSWTSKNVNCWSHTCKRSMKKTRTLSRSPKKSCKSWSMPNSICEATINSMVTSRRTKMAKTKMLRTLTRSKSSSCWWCSKCLFLKNLMIEYGQGYLEPANSGNSTRGWGGHGRRRLGGRARARDRGRRAVNWGRWFPDRTRNDWLKAH